jgi:hypothetical protein
MTTITTPKTAAFRTLVQKAATLHADISTLNDAIRERDVIKARMGDCRDEAEARKHLADLMRAEETVIVKQVREPHLQTELSDLLTQTDDAFHLALTEVKRITEDAPKEAVAAFQDMLVASQLDPEIRKVEQANPIVVNAIRPRALASELEDKIQEAWRAVSFSDQALARRVEAYKTALAWLDKVLVAHAEVVAEDKLMTVACEAFRKVLAKA